MGLCSRHFCAIRRCYSLLHSCDLPTAALDTVVKIHSCLMGSRHARDTQRNASMLCKCINTVLENHVPVVQRGCTSLRYRMSITITAGTRPGVPERFALQMSSLAGDFQWCSCPLLAQCFLGMAHCVDRANMMLFPLVQRCST